MHGRSGWRRWRVYLAAGTTTWTAVATSNAPLAVAAGAVTYTVTIWGQLGDALDQRQSRGQWWSHTTLAEAMTVAGILPRDPPPKLLRPGRRVTTDAGTAIVVALPPGVPHAQVVARRPALAAALHIPLNRLAVTQEDDDAANVTRLWVATPRDTTAGPTPAAVGQAGRTRWQDPVRIGDDDRGRPVALDTDEQNTIIAGQPGKGKTSLARVVLAHYLLDPTASVYLLDGKGSERDYGQARPLCDRFVFGTDETAIEDTVTLLRDVLDVVRDRNRASGDAAKPGGVLVLLEELQDVRAAADRATRDDLDNLLGRIVRMGRAVGVSILVSTQRPSVDDLPSGVRNLISQRIALPLRNGEDARLVLGETPQVTMPKRRGEGILVTPEATRTVTLHLLDADAWTGVCLRAAQLRPTPALAPAEPTPGPPPVVDVPPSPADPVLAATLAVLADSHPDGAPASTILTRLPTDLAPPSAAALGLLLRRFPGHVVQVQVRVDGRPTRVWRAV